MRVVRSPDELPAPPAKVCLGMGFFDGVHLGHQQVIRQTLADAAQQEALGLIITFDRHPNTVVAPDRVPPLIYPLHKKLQVIESMGAEALLLIHFDAPFSAQSGETFIRGLANQLPPIKSICVGANFVFGHKRGGNVELLRRLGSELNFAVHGLAAVSLDGQPVSSTRIRQAIAGGDLDTASQMLGRAYSLSGAVIRGDGLGQQLGFPTANLDVAALALPPHGVYAVHARVQDRNVRAVLNIGCRPTLADAAPRLQVEAHLIDFSGDLYGQDLEVLFVARLRAEKKFASPRELRQQIARDILDAQMLF